MTDCELTACLADCDSREARRCMQVLLQEPHRIVPCPADTRGALRAEVRKVYAKRPLVKGRPAEEQHGIIRRLADELEAPARFALFSNRRSRVKSCGIESFHNS